VRCTASARQASRAAAKPGGRSGRWRDVSRGRRLGRCIGGASLRQRAGRRCCDDRRRRQSDVGISGVSAIRQLDREPLREHRRWRPRRSTARTKRATASSSQSEPSSRTSMRRFSKYSASPARNYRHNTTRRTGWQRASALRRSSERRTRDEWIAAMSGHDACFAPVLDIDEAPKHPQMKARNVFTTFDDVLHPSPAPRFSRTPGELRRPAPSAGQHSREALTVVGSRYRADRFARIGRCDESRVASKRHAGAHRVSLTLSMRISCRELPVQARHEQCPIRNGRFDSETRPSTALSTVLMVIPCENTATRLPRACPIRSAKVAITPSR